MEVPEGLEIDQPSDVEVIQGPENSNSRKAQLARVKELLRFFYAPKHKPGEVGLFFYICLILL